MERSCAFIAREWTQIGTVNLPAADQVFPHRSVSIFYHPLPRNCDPQARDVTSRSPNRGCRGKIKCENEDDVYPVSNS